MKNSLRATTALATAMLTALSAEAIAAAPKLSISGFTEQDVGISANDAKAVGGRTAVDQHTDSEVYFNFATTLDNGIKITGRIELEANTSSDQVDEHFMRISGSFGELTLGSEDYAANRFAIEPPQVGIGLEDIDNWIHDTVSGTVHIDEDGLGFDSEHVTYITPSFGGFRLGVSYIPGQSQDANNSPLTRAAQRSEGWSGAVGYGGKFGDVGVSLAAGFLTFTTGPSAQTSVGDPWEYTISGALSFGGFTVGAAYVRFDDMLETPTSTAAEEDGYGIEAGIAYGQGPWSVSLAWHHGEAEGTVANTAKDRSDLWIASAAYALGPGVTARASVFAADWRGEDAETATTSDDNDGIGAAMGIAITF